MNTTSSLSNNTGESIPRREREKLAHRQDILDAASRVFAHKGFFNATLDEVAHEAEFSKGALYLYFSSKEDLLYNIIKEKTTGLMSILNEFFDEKTSFQEVLRKLLKKLAEKAFDEKDFLSIFITQHTEFFKSLSPEKAEEICTVHEKFDKLVINRIKKAIEHGELRNISPRAIHGIIHGASENMMFNRWDCATLDELYKAVDVFLDILFNGIAKQKGVCSEQ